MELADKNRTLTKFQVDEMAIRQNGNQTKKPGTFNYLLPSKSSIGKA